MNKKHICGECEERVATYRCEDCGTYYCDECADLNDYTCECVKYNIVPIEEVRRND